MGKGRAKRPKEIPPAQLDLVAAGALGDGFSDPAASVGAARVQWTAQQIKDRRPETYRDCLDMLAGGMPVLRIARCLHLAPESVRAIRADGMSLSQYKQRLGVQQLFAGELATEAVIEDLSNETTRASISAKDKAVIAGIMGQRGNELTSGGVTVSVNVSVPLTADQYRGMLASMGSGGGSPGQKAPLPVEVEVSDCAQSASGAGRDLHAPRGDDNGDQEPSY